MAESIRNACYMLLLCMLVQGIRAEFYSQQYFNFTMSDELYDFNDIKFQMDSEYDGHLLVKYRFYNQDESIDYQGQGVLFQGDQNREWNMGKLPFNYREGGEQLDVYGYDLVSGEERFNFSLNEFMYFQTRDEIEFECSGMYRSNEDITFTLTNNMNETMYYNYTFSSDDDELDNSGRGQFYSGDAMRENMGQIPRNWAYSRNFTLSLDVYDEEGEWRYGTSFNNFTYNDQAYDFQMSNNFHFGDEYVTFDFTNFMDDSVDVEWAFEAENGSRMFEQEWNFKSGEHRQVTVSKFFDFSQMMKDDQDWFFTISGQFQNSDMQFAEEVRDFNDDDNNDESGQDWRFTMPKHFHDGEDVGFTVTNRMQSSNMEVIYYLSWDDEKYNRAGQQEIFPSSQVTFSFEGVYNYDKSDSFRFYIAGYNQDTQEQIFSRMYTDFRFEQSRYNFKLPETYQLGGQFNFTLENNNFELPVTKFEYVFGTHDGAIERNGTFEMKSGESIEMEVYRFPMNWEEHKHRNFTFIMRGLNPDTDEEIYRNDFDYMRFFGDQDKNDNDDNDDNDDKDQDNKDDKDNHEDNFEMSQRVNAGERVSFSFTNTMNDVMYLYYSFFSDDGSVSFRGNEMVNPDETLEQNVGMMPRDYENSTDFRFELRGFREDEQVFEIVRDNFKYGKRSYMFDMDMTIFADKNITFTMENMMESDRMAYNWRFYSDDGEFEFQGHSKLWAGHNKVNNVGKIPRNYNGSRNFQFEINGFNDNNDEELFSETMSNFFFETGTYTIFMPQVVRPGFDITFSMTSTRRSESMILVYDFYSDDMEVQFIGDAEIRRGESTNYVIGTIPRGYQGSQNFRFNISGFDAETNEKVFYEETENFRFERKSVSMVMESNQDMYRSGDTMRFRCVVLSPDLLPMQGNIEYFFEGPNGEVFRQNRTRLQQGVVDGEMPLHENCQDGDWQVRVVYKQQEEVMKFRVTSEKRQSFNVKVWAPEYYYDEMEGLYVKFEANFRQGDGVRGQARLQAEIKAPFNSYNKHNKQSNVFRQSFDNFDQNGMFFMSKETLRKLGWQSWTDLMLEVSVSVTARCNKETYEDMAVVELKRTNIKLDVQYRPQTIKPGMSYTAHIKVSEQDDKPLTSEDRSRNDLIVDVEYRYPIRGLSDNFVFSADWADSLIYTPPKIESYVMKIPENGEVDFNMNVYDDEFEYVSFRCYTNTTSKLYGLSKTSQWIVKPTESPSRSFIQCQSDKNQYAVGDRVHFNVQFSEEISRFSIMVLSRGMIMMQRKYQFKEASREFDVGFDTTFQMAPGVKVFVTYVRSDGELVADYFSVALVENLIHEVDMSVSEEHFGFNQEMAVNVQTGSADSYVGVAVRNFDDDDNKRMNRMERRMRSERQITQERVMEDMQEYSYSSNDQDDQDDEDDRSREEPWWQWRWTRPSGAMSTNAAFDDVNMNVMTDAKMQDWDRDTYEQQRRQRNSNRRMMRKPRKSRQNFNDQSWMWMNRKSNDDGSVRFNASTPRMVSSYSVRAFVVSHNGFGVSEDKNFKVYEKLFLNIDAPRRVTKDEVMIVQSTVFNYNKQDLAVQMVMENSDDFELLMPGEDPTMSGPVRWLTVPAGGSARVDYPVRMNTLGDVELSVQVRSNRGEASLTRNVQVQPQGNRQCYTYSANINRRNNSYSQRPSSYDTFKVEFPENAVEGSRQAELVLYSDIMRGTMEYFGDLVQQPSGNGEQNMVDFAPATYMYHYLKYHQYNGEAWTMHGLRKFRDFMATAYQNQQNYKHKDGSYSMFGEKEEFGSTWLTAYVYKIYKSMFNSFPFNEGQRNETRETMDFLMKQQNEDGSFRERGNFFNRKMQSDNNERNSRVALTAFVTIAMMEGGSRENFKVENKYRFAEAGQYMESQLENIKDDQYTLSMVAYALNMMNVSSAQRAMDYFENFRNSNGDKEMMYWNMRDSYRSKYQDDTPYAHPSAISVEMTSYALLSYTKRQEWEKARQVMNWLVANRNSMGGFRGSYSTAIAVQALTQWRMEQNYRYTQDMEVRMSHSEDNQFNNNTVMNQYQDFYRIDVPSMNGNVELLTSGQGMAFAQLEVCYNIMETPYKQETFDCSQNTHSNDIDSAEVEYCCRLQRNDMNKAGLFFFQIELPNGFSVDAQDQRKRNPDARWMNFDERSFNVYYDELEPDQEVCARAKMYRTNRVASNKRAFMTAQDYYNPERRNVQWYTIDRFEDSKACNVCGMACSGCPGPRLSEWRETVPCVSCDQKFSTWRRECVDPSLNMNLDASECYEDEQEERRACNNTSVFPICPDSHDGLWRVMPSYADKELNAQDDSQMCNLRPGYLRDYTAAEYDNAAKNGVPGTDMEFYKAYLECDMDQSSFGDEGDFSLSMMVNVQSFKNRGKGVIFAYGDENKPAVFKLWHHSMYGSPIVFRVSLNNFIYTVGPIDGRNLIQKWTHIMVTWNKQDTSFYINGTSVGWSFHFPSRKQQNKPQNPKLFIGRDTQDNKGDTLNGWVSSLDFWSRTLNNDEARQVYNFYRPVVEASRNDNDDAEMPYEALRYMAPDAYKQCFNQNSSIMDLFRRETCREDY